MRGTKKALAALLAALLLALAACAAPPADPSATPSETPAATPAATPGDPSMPPVETPADPSETPAAPSPATLSEAARRAQADFAPAVAEAAAALERVRRDELSAETYAYEGEAEALPADLDEEELAYYEAALDYIVASMPEGLSAYDQYRYLAFVLSLRAAYDYGAGEDGHNQTAYGALVEGLGVCLGYTNAMQALCRRADLWCEPITGFARWNEGDHGWNLVKLEDGTYYIDVTWCDQYGAPGSEAWQGCFMLTEARLQEDHGVWEGGPATGTAEY